MGKISRLCCPQGVFSLKTSLLDLTRDLIEQDTVSAHGTGKTVDFVANELNDFGFKTRLQETTEGEVRQTNLIAWAGPAEPDGVDRSRCCGPHGDTGPAERNRGGN